MIEKMEEGVFIGSKEWTIVSRLLEETSPKPSDEIEEQEANLMLVDTN